MDTFFVGQTELKEKKEAGTRNGIAGFKEIAL